MSAPAQAKGKSSDQRPALSSFWNTNETPSHKKSNPMMTACSHSDTLPATR